MDFGADEFNDFNFDVFASDSDDDEDYGQFLPMTTPPFMGFTPAQVGAVDPADTPPTATRTNQPTATRAFINNRLLYDSYIEIADFMGSNHMFNGMSWAHMKHAYRGPTYNFEEWRRAFDFNFFFVVDMTNSTRLREWQSRSVIGGRSDGAVYTRRQENSDHHTIPPVCCDSHNRSLMWTPIDIPLRTRSYASHMRVNRGQPLFADHIAMPSCRHRDHPISRYQSFLHGVMHRDTQPPPHGYYPLASDLAGCRNYREHEALWAQREPLTLADGVDILKKLASADPNSWTAVMDFLPYNEKCGFAQYLSHATARRVYGVSYPVSRPPPKPSAWNVTRFMFTANGLYHTPRIAYTRKEGALDAKKKRNRAGQHLNDWMIAQGADSLVLVADHAGGADHFGATAWGGWRRRRAAQIKSESVAIGKTLLYARFSNPFHVLWRLKMVYDLSNFCNRHDVRCNALATINANINEHLMPAIHVYSIRMTNMAVTKVLLDGTSAQDHLAARHTVDHKNYMQAWEDLSAMASLSTFHDEPSVDDKQVCFSNWQKHSMRFNAKGLAPEYEAPLVATQWHTHRLNTLVRITNRYMGKSYNDLQLLLLDGDCALRHNVIKEDAKGRTTVLNLISVQISCAIGIDMKLLNSRCTSHNYQEMACPVAANTTGPAHRCGDGHALCLGCDCSQDVKVDTSYAVERMLAKLGGYRGDDLLYTSSAVQLENHLSRKRYHPAHPPVSGANIFERTVFGLEALLTNDICHNEHPPLSYDYIRRNIHP